MTERQTDRRQTDRQTADDRKTENLNPSMPYDTFAFAGLIIIIKK